MTINKKNLTIIIVTLKSHNIIDRCLKAIDANVKKIVVENSSDENFKINLEKKYKNLKCFLTNNNLGMGKGNNYGIKKSKTRYVMIINPDTILKKNTLKEIFKISKNLNFSIIAPVNENRKNLNYKISKKLDKKFKNLLEVDIVDGYAMVLDKKKFQNQYFDKNIFMFLENDDLCIRTKSKKNKIYICQKSKVIHLGHKAVDEKYFKEIEYCRNWHWYWSKFYFKKKHFGFLNAFFSEIIPFLKSLIKYLIYFFSNNSFKKKKYLYRILGFLNALVGNKSWYRPKFS